MSATSRWSAWAVLVGVSAVWSLALAQEVPNVIAGANGQAEAVFSSNNCVVYYNANGSRRSNLPACRSDQIGAADRGVAAYRREQGLAGGASSDAPPIVNIGETGFGSVSYSDGCVINYRQDGSRQNMMKRCDAEQVHRADDAMARYRREQGLDRGGYSAGSQPPEVSFNDRTGFGTVRFQDGCVATYRGDGSRMSSSSRCNGDEMRRADDAMDRYRREQGMYSNRYDANPPRVAELRGGVVQMLYTEPFCSVLFNKNGIRTSKSKTCTSEQLVDSGLRIIKFRRDRGM